ncbi:MAG TPA: hypothetical protein VL137_01275 [Polyangiaceae bacterium]|nr:hypothetical protein [Polyangiaceae bacterium]
MPFRRNNALLALFGAAALITPAIASAQESEASPGLPIDFSWSAPEGCPTREQVIAELNKAVDIDQGTTELPSLTAQADVEHEGNSWHLDLFTQMDGRRGRRFLEADSCEGLARATTLVLALTLGEGIARRKQEAAQAQPTAPNPAPPPPLAVSEVEPPISKSEHALLWGALAAGSDPLGGFGPALAVAAAYQPSALQIGARFEATLPRSTHFAGFAGDVRSFSIVGEAQGCFAPTLPPLQPFACANVGVTLLRANGKGSAQEHGATIPLYSLGPSIGARWLLNDALFLNLGFGSRFFLKRPELVVQGLVQTRRVEIATVTAELGMGVRW